MTRLTFAFAEMIQTDPDPNHQSYASYWLIQTEFLKKNETALRDCGQKALSHAARILGASVEADALYQLTVNKFKKIDAPWTDDTISWIFNDVPRSFTRTAPRGFTETTTTNAIAEIATITNPLGTLTKNRSGLGNLL